MMNPLKALGVSAWLAFAWGLTTAAQAAVIHVKASATGAKTGASWANAYTELAPALNAAADGDEIWIAGDTYFPDYDPASGTHTGNRDLRFVLKSGVSLYGGFAGDESVRSARDWVANRTILSGDIGAPGVATDNTRTIMSSSGSESAPKVIIDGLVFANGQADSPAELGSGIVSGSGGALHLRIQTADIRNCVFIKNYAIYGGAIEFKHTSLAGSLILTQCLFSANSAKYVGGAVNCAGNDSSLNVRQSTFVNNTGSRAPAIGVNTMVACSYYNNLIHTNPSTDYSGTQPVESGVLVGNTAYGNVVHHPLLQITTGDTGLVVASPGFAQLPSPGADGRWGTMDDVLIATLSATSPALGAALLAHAPADPADLDGDANTAETLPLDLRRAPRLRGSVLDAGAFAFLNTAPSGLSLSPASVAENQAPGTVVGSFSATDAEGGPLSYALVEGEGSADNARFALSGATLRTAESLDFETRPTHSIRVRVADTQGAFAEQVFTLVVTDGYDPTPNDFELAQTSLSLSAVPGVNEAPIRVKLAPALPSFDFGAVTVSDNASWLAATLDATTGELVLTFQTAGLVNASSPAVVTVRSGGVTRTLAVTAAAAPLKLVRLVDDPVRSRMYGVQQNGANTGAIVVFDPLTTKPSASISVGANPSDLDVSPDGAELAVICPGDPSIWIIDLATLAVRERIPLTLFHSINPASGIRDAKVAFGPSGILYYVDAGWGPLLRVLRRSDRAVIQSAGIDGPAADDTESNAVNGFGDLVVSADRTRVYGWARYGDGAGWAGSYGAAFSIGADGKLALLQKSASAYPTPMERDPLDTPALLTADGATVFLKQLAFGSADFSTPSRTFGSPIYSISPGGEIAVTGAAILETATGKTLHSLTGAGVAQAVTHDYARLVWFDATTRQLRSLNLLKTVGASFLERRLSPAETAIVTTPAELRWSPIPGVDRYNVYLGTSASGVAAATPTSRYFLGTSTGASRPLDSALASGITYYWRVDALNGTETIAGNVHSFIVSAIIPSVAKIQTATLAGHASQSVSVGLSGGETPVAWTASSDRDWIKFENASGLTPSDLRLVLDASALPAGLQRGSVTLQTASGSLTLPVELQVDPLAITRLIPAPGSTHVYALSEQGFADSVAGSRAYLLEIDTLRERLSRVVRVGSGASDLAFHRDDGRVYVTNWRIGRLLAVDLSDFTVADSFDMPPFDGVGYSDDDVYRLSAGGPGRLVYEAADQWINVGILDTDTGQVLDTTFEREGDGAYAPDHRHYYHGDNNSSAAALHKYDTTGDLFTELGSVRSGGYGSRTVLVSDDGARVFWSGMVFDADLNVLWKLSEEINAISGDGRYAFSASKIYDTVAKRAIGDMPRSTSLSVYNSSTGRLVTALNGSLGFHLIPGLDAPGITRDPLAGSTILPRSTLSWTGLPASASATYRVYLGASEAAVAAATPGSAEYLGEFDSASLTLAEALAAGAYFWRVDIVLDGEVVPGAVQSFHVAPLMAAPARIDAATVYGHSGLKKELVVTLHSAAATWSATTDQSWIRLTSASGDSTTPLRLELDASAVNSGLHAGSVTITGDGASLVVPVSFLVETLEVKVLRSDPDSARVFALSQIGPADSPSTQAYLVEFDAAENRIVRAVPAGRGVTDLAIHPDDGRIYVTNWNLACVLAFDLQTLEQTDRFAGFYPPGLGWDAYRVAAGGPGRIVVEGGSDWGGIALVDTASGQILSRAPWYEGGGVYDVTGRYYFHGDNDTSDASLRRFDTTGDVWTELSSLRGYPTGDYYGANDIVRSEDGSRIFWNRTAFTVEPFAKEWGIGEKILTSSADGRIAFSAASAWDLSTRTALWNLSYPGDTPMTYNSASDSLVVYLDSRRLIARPTGYVLPLVTPTLSVIERGPFWLRTEADDRNLGTSTELQWRALGAETWRGGGASDLTPDTTYELRVRTLNPFGDSAWSEVVVATTLPRPTALPDLVLDSLAPAVTLGENYALNLPVSSEWAYQFQNLPEGLVFDAATGLLSGVVSEPGRYEFTIIVGNAGGSRQATLVLAVRDPGAIARTAHYTGLLGGYHGLNGRWNLSRDGRKFTAKVVTNWGDFSLLGKFEDFEGSVVADLGARLLGRPIRVGIVFDDVLNRVFLSIRFTQEDWTADTVELTGQASPWSARKLPHPGAGAYTALIVPLYDNEAETYGDPPQGDGYLRVQLGADGVASLTGRNALGRLITYSNRLQVDSVLPLFMSDKYGGQIGALGFSSASQAGPEIQGRLNWTHYSAPKAKFYPDGFFRFFRVAGSRFTPAQNNADLLADGADFDVILGGGDLYRMTDYLDFVQPATLGAKGVVLPKPGSAENPRSVKLSYLRRTGAISGEATFVENHPVSGKKVTRKITFVGLAVTDIDGAGTFHAAGHFLLSDFNGRTQSGFVRFVRRGETFDPAALAASAENASAGGTLGLGGSNTGASGSGGASGGSSGTGSTGSSGASSGSVTVINASWSSIDLTELAISAIGD